MIASPQKLALLLRAAQARTSDVRRSIISLDVGTRNIGVAISDESFTCALPYRVVKQPRGASGIVKTANTLSSIIHGTHAIGVVVGWPLELDGTEGKQCDKTNRFIRRFLLRQPLQVPITYWDERFSSQVAAEESMGVLDRGSLMDAFAAKNILQDFLDTVNTEDGDVDLYKSSESTPIDKRKGRQLKTNLSLTNLLKP
eukprot:g1628.t1